MRSGVTHVSVSVMRRPVLSKYISKEYHYVCNSCGGKGCDDCHGGWGCNGPSCEKCERLGEPVNGQRPISPF